MGWGSGGRRYNGRLETNVTDSGLHGIRKMGIRRYDMREGYIGRGTWSTLGTVRYNGWVTFG